MTWENGDSYAERDGTGAILLVHRKTGPCDARCACKTFIFGPHASSYQKDGTLHTHRECGSVEGARLEYVPVGRIAIGSRLDSTALATVSPGLRAKGPNEEERVRQVGRVLQVGLDSLFLAVDETSPILPGDVIRAMAGGSARLGSAVALDVCRHEGRTILRAASPWDVLIPTLARGDFVFVEIETSAQIAPGAMFNIDRASPTLVGTRFADTTPPSDTDDGWFVGDVAKVLFLRDHAEEILLRSEGRPERFKHVADLLWRDVRAKYEAEADRLVGLLDRWDLE
jgi:hypothetical protein